MPFAYLLRSAFDRGLRRTGVGQEGTFDIRSWIGDNPILGKGRLQGSGMEDRVELLTERLRLRRARQGDAPVLFKNYTGAQNCSRFLQRRADEDVAHTETMLEQWCITAWYEAGAPFSWVISTLDDDEPIGLFVVIPEGHKTEIHFGIGERFWGRGLAVEAGRAAISALWRSPNVQRIWTVCDVENTGSRRVLEKLGFQCEGTLRKWLVLPAFGNAARDCYVFSSMSHRRVE